MSVNFSLTENVIHKTTTGVFVVKFVDFVIENRTFWSFVSVYQNKSTLRLLLQNRLHNRQNRSNSASCHKSYIVFLSFKVRFTSKTTFRSSYFDNVANCQLFVSKN